MQRLSAQDKPILTVFNKIDRVDPNLATRLVAEWPNSVAVSAVKGTGMDTLMQAIVNQVQELLGLVQVLLPYSEQSLLQDCYDFGRVRLSEFREAGVFVEAEVVAELREKLRPYAI